MQAVIYAGLRNGARDQAIHDALIYKHVADVASEFKLSPNTVRAAAKRIANVSAYDLVLLGGGVALFASARSSPTHSARLLSAHTVTTGAHFRIWSCPAG
jgi:hypothetical protein